MELIISFDPATGQVGLSGPLEQRMLCYGMLEMAREILVKQGGQPSANPLIAVPGNGHLRLS